MEKFSFKIVLTLQGFYDPEKETKTDAETRVALKAEMSVNQDGEIRAHILRFMPVGEKK